jgi:hypothetical protein
LAIDKTVLANSSRRTSSPSRRHAALGTRDFHVTHHGIAQAAVRTGPDIDAASLVFGRVAAYGKPARWQIRRFGTDGRNLHDENRPPFRG